MPRRHCYVRRVHSGKRKETVCRLSVEPLLLSVCPLFSNVNAVTTAYAPRHPGNEARARFGHPPV